MRRLVVHDISVKHRYESAERAARNTAVEELHAKILQIIFVILCYMADVPVTVSDAVTRKYDARAVGKYRNIHFSLYSP
jgi:hypothetical protein